MLRGAEPVPTGAKLALVLRMSVPAMMAEFVSMAMSFIDAAMIGRLGTADAAAVGLMASSTWLFGGVCWAGVVGFSVQIAQARTASLRSTCSPGSSSPSARNSRRPHPAEAAPKQNGGHRVLFR